MANFLLKGSLLITALTALSYCSNAQCDKVANLSTATNGPTGANVSWDVDPTAVKYEYIVALTPLSNGPGTYTTTTSVQLSGLAPNTTYYFCVRTICSSGISEWSCGELKTPDAASVNTVNGNNGIAISVYPNPTSSKLTLALPEYYVAKGRLMVTNMLGAVVYKTNVDSRFTHIEMGHLAPGMYLVKYADGNNSQTIRINKL